jgi:hydrogenase nickel incorporation protein HypA/HybF
LVIRLPRRSGAKAGYSSFVILIMHELSIASSLVEKLLEFSAQNPDGAIIEVRLQIGELSHIDAEALSFCYEAITKETPIEGSSLVIERIPALVKCPYCSYRGRPKYWDDVLVAAPVITMRCPKCGETVAADQGRECAIKSVRLSEANAAQTL